MGYIPPPKPLTYEEFIMWDMVDRYLARWFRYSGVIGKLTWLYDFFRGKLI